MAVRTLYGCYIHPVNLDESFYACFKCKFLCVFNFGADRCTWHIFIFYFTNLQKIYINIILCYINEIKPGTSKRNTVLVYCVIYQSKRNLLTLQRVQLCERNKTVIFWAMGTTICKEKFKLHRERKGQLFKVMWRMETKHP